VNHCHDLESRAAERTREEKNVKSREGPVKYSVVILEISALVALAAVSCVEQSYSQTPSVPHVSIKLSELL
jgi:hypothetical protein